MVRRSNSDAITVEYAGLVFAVMRGLNGDVDGVMLGLMLSIYARQHRRPTNG